MGLLDFFCKITTFAVWFIVLVYSSLYFKHQEIWKCEHQVMGINYLCELVLKFKI